MNTPRRVLRKSLTSNSKLQRGAKHLFRPPNQLIAVASGNDWGVAPAFLVDGNQLKGCGHMEEGSGVFGLMRCGKRGFRVTCSGKLCLEHIYEGSWGVPYSEQRIAQGHLQFTQGT
jgi:hypothetical protein